MNAFSTTRRKRTAAFVVLLLWVFYGLPVIVGLIDINRGFGRGERHKTRFQAKPRSPMTTSSCLG